MALISNETARQKIYRRAPASVCLTLVMLAGCQSPAQRPEQTAAANTGIADICEETMSFDVSSVYFPRCVNYLAAHARTPQPAVLGAVSEPAEHRACHQIGLPDGSSEYQSCVQEMDQLDLGSAHL